jgi:hypothetical protein
MDFAGIRMIVNLAIHCVISLPQQSVERATPPAFRAQRTTDVKQTSMALMVRVWRTTEPDDAFIEHSRDIVNADRFDEVAIEAGVG